MHLNLFAACLLYIAHFVPSVLVAAQNDTQASMKVPVEVLPELGAPEDRKIKCLTSGAAHDNPEVYKCLDALLRTPASGIPATFVRQKQKEYPYLPQDVHSENCVVRFDFVSEGTEGEFTSWLQLRQTATELIFYCYKPGSNRVRGYTIMGDRGNIKVSVGKPHNIGNDDSDMKANGTQVFEVGNSRVSGENVSTS